jgi:hypothetical protein
MGFFDWLKPKTYENFDEGDAPEPTEELKTPQPEVPPEESTEIAISDLPPIESEDGSLSIDLFRDRFDAMQSALPNTGTSIQITPAREMLQRVIDLDNGLSERLENALRAMAPQLIKVLSEMVMAEESMTERIDAHEERLKDHAILEAERSLREMARSALLEARQMSINNRYALIRRMLLVLGLHDMVKRKHRERAERAGQIEAQISALETAQGEAREDALLIQRADRLGQLGDSIIERGLMTASLELASAVRTITTAEMDLILSHAHIILTTTETRERLEEELDTLAQIREDEVDLLDGLHHAELIGEMTVALTHDQKIEDDAVEGATQQLFLEVHGAFPDLMETLPETEEVLQIALETTSPDVVIAPEGAPPDDSLNGLPLREAPLSIWIDYLLEHGHPHTSVTVPKALLRLFKYKRVSSDDLPLSRWEALRVRFPEDAAFQKQIDVYIEVHTTRQEQQQADALRLQETNRPKYPDCQAAVQTLGVSPHGALEIVRILREDAADGLTMHSRQLLELAGQFADHQTVQEVVIAHPNTWDDALAWVLSNTPVSFPMIKDAYEHPNAGALSWSTMLNVDHVIELILLEKQDIAFIISYLKQPAMGVGSVERLFRWLEEKQYLEFKSEIIDSYSYEIHRKRDGDDHFARNNNHNYYANLQNQINHIEFMARFVNELLDTFGVEQLPQNWFKQLVAFTDRMPRVNGHYGIKHNEGSGKSSTTGTTKPLQQISAMASRMSQAREIDTDDYNQLVCEMPPGEYRHNYLSVLRNPHTDEGRLRDVYTKPDRGGRFTSEEANTLIENPRLSARGLAYACLACDEDHLDQVWNHPYANGFVQEKIKRERSYVPQEAAAK